MRTWDYVIRRILLLLFLLVGISVVTFVLARVIPSDPAATYVGPLARPEQIAQARIELGLDRPLYVQYWRYAANLLRGNWGTSLRTHRPVLEDIARFLPGSLELIAVSLILSALAGIPLGALSAQYRGGWIDQVGRVISLTGVSISSFWLGLLLQIIFFRVLHLLPVAGRVDLVIEQTNPLRAVTGFYVIDALLTWNLTVLKNAVVHLVLPGITLAAYPTGVITRMTRAQMLEILEQEYVRAARALGVPRRAITFKYALKNALGPTLTILGLALAYSLTGAFFVEMIFAWPGLGTYAVQSILGLDYPAIVGVTLVVATFYVAINLVIDLLQVWLDPRIVLR